MKKVLGICITGMLATLMTPLAMTAAPAIAPFGGGYVQDGWDVPPAEFDEMTRHGFRDGVNAARSDYKDHKQPDVNRHDTYRHPSVSARDKEPFRRGFLRGYQVATDHLWNRP